MQIVKPAPASGGDAGGGRGGVGLGLHLGLPQTQYPNWAFGSISRTYISQSAKLFFFIFSRTSPDSTWRAHSSTVHHNNSMLIKCSSQQLDADQVLITTTRC